MSWERGSGIDELIERNPDQLKIYFTPRRVSIPLKRIEDTFLLISTQMPFYSGAVYSSLVPEDQDLEWTTVYIGAEYKQR